MGENAKKIKVLLVDQIGHKTYEYDYAAAKHYSSDYDVTCYISDNTPRNVDTTGFNVVYGFHDVYSGNKIQKGIKYIKALSEMKRCIKENHFDIVNLQWYELALYQKLLLRSLKRSCTPAPKVVMTVHGIFPKSRGWFRHFSLQAVYNEADAILLHSEQGVKYFNENYITSCPKYMITSAFRDENDYIAIDKAEAKRRLGIPAGDKVVLSFGTVREDKTIDVLYKAFPIALQKNPNLFLISAGTLNVREKEYYISLADVCRATGKAKINFDYISKDMEPVYYSAADILALPYSYISQSGVAYCGLLFNLPMVASDIPRLDLMAKEGVNAEIFVRGDVNAMAEKLAILAADNKKLVQYAEGSKRIREEDFSIRRRVALTEHAYRDLLEIRQEVGR